MDLENLEKVLAGESKFRLKQANEAVFKKFRQFRQCEQTLGEAFDYCPGYWHQSIYRDRLPVLDPD